jgi:hypothetical protein
MMRAINVGALLPPLQEHCFHGPQRYSNGMAGLPGMAVSVYRLPEREGTHVTQYDM